MPRISESARPAPQPLSPADAYAATWNRFESGFQRSSKGNLWCVWEGRRVGIYKRGEDQFGWYMSDEEEVLPNYSPNLFGSEEEAISALGEALGVGL
jgi:hypothetical protein